MKESILIVSGTDRPNAMTRKVALYYQKVLEDLGCDTSILDLADLNKDFIGKALYHNTGKYEHFNGFVSLVSAHQKFVFILPEYNGSYPGILKTFIDGLPYPNALSNKKAALVGISANMQGGGIALSHLSDVFSYLGMHTLALRVKLGQIKTHFQDGQFTNSLYRELIDTQARQLLDF
ncbi:MAG: NAD(P)H-dependent oxidoreductase [Spirosomataceae bacterium]